MVSFPQVSQPEPCAHLSSVTNYQSQMSEDLKTGLFVLETSIIIHVFFKYVIYLRSRAFLTSVFGLLTFMPEVTFERDALRHDAKKIPKIVTQKSASSIFLALPLRYK